MCSFSFSTSVSRLKNLDKMILYIITLFAVFVFFALRNKNSLKYSKFPSGPLSLPIVGSVFSLGTNPHEKLSQLKNKYGNVVAIDFGSRRGIVLNDVETIKHAFSLKEFQNRAHTEVLKLIRGPNCAGIAFSSGRRNEEQRSFVLKVLKNFGMGKKSIEHLLIEEMERLFEVFDGKVGIPVVNDELFQLTAVSALWSIMTGKHGIAENSEFMETINQVRKVGNNFNIFTMFMPTISKVFSNVTGWSDLVQAGMALYDYCGNIVRTRQETLEIGEEPKDLVDAYLNKIQSTKDETSTFFGETGIENLQGVIADFLGAGTDTVSASLSWYLCTTMYHPEVQKKIQSEIDKAIGKSRLPSLSDRQQLPYLEAVVFEILRYSALVPMGLPHETSEDVEIEGYLIPKGTVVIPNAYDALHDPKKWNEPEVFNPERFLKDDGTAIDRNIARNVDIVFGHGKRICPGEALAKDEVFLFIAGLSQRYNFTRDPSFDYGQKVETTLGISLIPKPHHVIINKR